MSVGGQDLPMVKSSDNYFILTSGGPFSFPASVTITSIFGDTVTDTVPAGPVGTFIGGAQFPLNSQYTSVGGAGAVPGLVLAQRMHLQMLVGGPCAELLNLLRPCWPL